MPKAGGAPVSIRKVQPVPGSVLLRAVVPRGGLVCRTPLEAMQGSQVEYSDKYVSFGLRTETAFFNLVFLQILKSKCLPPQKLGIQTRPETCELAREIVCRKLPSHSFAGLLAATMAKFWFVAELQRCGAIRFQPCVTNNSGRFGSSEIC
jgi:hypothetical protein